MPGIFIHTCFQTILQTTNQSLKFPEKEVYPSKSSIEFVTDMTWEGDLHSPGYSGIQEPPPPARSSSRDIQP
ncbi:MAG: hypothetical protein ACOCSE_05550 [Chitinivibrionales bacterium]